MGGETDLEVLLKTLRPVLDPRQFGFGTVPHGSAQHHGLTPFGLFEEDEGTTVIAPSAELQRANIEHSAGWAKISLKVHSSLTAVGMTAAIAAALTEAGISANVVAAYYHDHVFVPWNSREKAMTVMSQWNVDFRVCDPAPIIRTV